MEKKPDYRRKMCEHCAFRKESHEMATEESKQDLVDALMMKHFFCHETMYQKNADDHGKWEGDFDNKRRPDGSECNPTDHQLCAGYMAWFGGSALGIECNDIDVTGHAKEEYILNERKDNAAMKLATERVLAVRGSYDAPGFDACVDAEYERLIKEQQNDN